MAMKNITIQSAVDEEEHGTILLEVAQFLKLYDMVNARVVEEAVKVVPAMRMYVFADRAGPFACSELQGEQLPIDPTAPTLSSLRRKSSAPFWCAQLAIVWCGASGCVSSQLRVVLPLCQ